MSRKTHPKPTTCRDVRPLLRPAHQHQKALPSPSNSPVITPSIHNLSMHHPIEPTSHSKLQAISLVRCHLQTFWRTSYLKVPLSVVLGLLSRSQYSTTSPRKEGRRQCMTFWYVSIQSLYVRRTF